MYVHAKHHSDKDLFYFGSGYVYSATPPIMEILMQKRFITFGMALFLCFFLKLCPVWSAENSAAITAILENDLFALQEELNHGIVPNTEDEHGYTPLDIVLTQGNMLSAPDIVKLLLQNGAKPGSSSADPALTLTRLLVTQAPLSQVESVLQNTDKVDAPLLNGFTPFLWAAAFCHDPAVLKALVKAGANPLQVLPGGDPQFGDNALLLAAEYNRSPQVIDFLLSCGLNVNSRSSLLGDSALMIACRANDNPDVAETLIRHGADVNMRNGVSYSAFMFAARRADRVGLMRLLAEKGADVLASDDSLFNALHIACSLEGTPFSVGFLLSAGLPVNGQCSKDFGAYTPLMLAVRNENPDAEVIRLLLQYGADPNLRDTEGKRAGDGLPAERVMWLKQNGLDNIL